MTRVSPDVVPVGLQEAQLGVVQDVEVGAAQAVARRPDEQVPVVFARLPPDGEVEGGAAQLEAGREQRVTENLRRGYTFRDHAAFCWCFISFSFPFLTGHSHKIMNEC